jgi:putative flavoprotein involved in K+ transport
VVDCVLVGAGPAGLAASTALTTRGVEHLVLERASVGQTWRTQRWDSLRLNNPGWMNPKLGEQQPQTYLSAAQVAERLRVLAAQCPVREHAPVLQLSRRVDRWLVCTGDGEIGARAVVVATGGENVPRTPQLARRLPDGIAQCHAAAYRCPQQLPDGAVLVVGSAQSGYQVTEELLVAGRRVFLATSAVGRAPARHRGRDTVEWLVPSGFVDQRPQDLSDPAVTRSPQPLLAPGGRSASLQLLARAGVRLTGRLVAVDGHQLRFYDSAARNVAAADAFAGRIRTMLDRMIAESSTAAPPAEPDEADAPVTLNPPLSLNLVHEGGTTVVWCTGYTGDFSWLDQSLTKSDGWPRRDGAAS